MNFVDDNILLQCQKVGHMPGGNTRLYTNGL